MLLHTSSTHLALDAVLPTCPVVFCHGEHAHEGRHLVRDSALVLSIKFGDPRLSAVCIGFGFYGQLLMFIIIIFSRTMQALALTNLSFTRLSKPVTVTLTCYEAGLHKYNLQCVAQLQTWLWATNMIVAISEQFNIEYQDIRGPCSRKDSSNSLWRTKYYSTPNKIIIVDQKQAMAGETYRCMQADNVSRVVVVFVASIVIQPSGYFHNVLYSEVLTTIHHTIAGVLGTFSCHTRSYSGSGEKGGNGTRNKRITVQRAYQAEK